VRAAFPCVKEECIDLPKSTAEAEIDPSCRSGIDGIALPPEKENRP
jgi:hypothetical protein